MSMIFILIQIKLNFEIINDELLKIIWEHKKKVVFFLKSSLVVHRNAKQREIIEHAQKQDTRPQDKTKQN
jgi:hypothetical protein